MVDHSPVVYGKYQLLELLARGGMAEVFKAKSHGVEGFEKILVIKRILPTLSENPQFVDMFINEAKLAVTLSHANIVQVFDLGRAEGRYFIAMEYVAGYDLATVLRLARIHRKPLPHELAVYIVSELAKGLDYAHRRRDQRMRPLNIVHRDVSPQNALLSYEGEVKLTDFGIAKARYSVRDESEVGVLKGKYAYMAPEQALGREVDARTDLFALGTVLYQALSGVNPFLEASTFDTLQKVREGKAVRVNEIASDVPEELGAIVARAMSVSPDDRHSNAGLLYEDLIQFLYASGRRVGAHDLSRYLDDLRSASETAPPDEQESAIELAFEHEHEQHSSVTPQRTVEETSVEVPLPTKAPASTSSTANGGSTKPRSTSPSSGAAVAKPHAEQQDVTALALLSGRADRTPESTVHSLLRRFGGMIVQQESASAGRSLVALFGAQEPDGRDTEHAARCALRIARAANASLEEGAPVSVKISVHTSRVLVEISGKLVEDERYGRLLTRARELAARAKPGQVLASNAAERPIRAWFEMTADGSGDQAAFVIDRERQIAEAYGKFVGRRAELKRMGEILALANRGKRRVIAVSGDAGIGKSRLLVETGRRLRLGGHDVGWHHVRIPRQSREVPLAACQEILRAVLGIDEFDPEPIIRDKVQRLRELGLPPAELNAVMVTLGLTGDPDGGGGVSLRSALAHIASKLAEDRLTVFALDGVESMDDESQAILDALFRDPRDARLAVVLAYRTGFVHAWSDLPQYYELVLEPLGEEDLHRLASLRLGTETVPPELLREVTAKSGGNPLYVEEYLKALSDAGAVEIEGEGSGVTYRPEVAQVEVPKTLRGIVSSRLSRLAPMQRHLLQIAAVAGARFTGALLSKVSGEDPASVAAALSVLEKRGLVVRQGASEHAFVHELLGGVLREGLPADALASMHGAVARALEELYPQRVDELAEQLADHYRETGNAPKAVDYLVRAADRLDSEHSLDGAIANLMKAIRTLQGIAGADRDRLLNLYRRIGDLSYRSRDLERGAERMAEALDLAEGLGRDEYVARFSMMRGRLLVNANKFAEGRRWLDRARRVARQLGTRELLRDINLASAEADTRNGEYVRGIDLLREALALSRETGDLTAQIRCLIPLALAHAATGDHGKAMEALEEARRLAGVHPDRYTECELHRTESLIHAYNRNHDAAIHAAARGLELAKEYGFQYEAAANAQQMAEGHLRMGDHKRAFAALRFAYELAREHGFTKLMMICTRVLGFIDAMHFGSDEGRARILRAAEYAQENGYVWDMVEAKYMLAIADHAQGSTEQARRGLREVLRMSVEHGNRRYEQDAEQALRALDAGEPVPLPS